MGDLLKKIVSPDIRNILALVTTVGCFILLYFMLFKDIPQGNKDVINTAIGFVFGSAMTGVYGYYFGASKQVNQDQIKDQ